MDSTAFVAGFTAPGEFFWLWAGPGSGLYRLVAQEMRGYSDAQARQIFRDLINPGGGIFPVTHRCHNRAFLLKFARDRDACRAMLREQLEEFEVWLLDYCLKGKAMWTESLAVGSAQFVEKIKPMILSRRASSGTPGSSDNRY